MLKKAVLALAELLTDRTYVDLLAQLAHRPWLSSVLLVVGIAVTRMVRRRPGDERETTHQGPEFHRDSEPFTDR